MPFRLPKYFHEMKREHKGFGLPNHLRNKENLNIITIFICVIFTESVVDWTHFEPSAFVFGPLVPDVRSTKKGSRTYLPVLHGSIRS